MTDRERIDRLDQRRRYLDLRIEIKARLSWENVYDVEERDALAWALDRLKAQDAAETVA